MRRLLVLCSSVLFLAAGCGEGEVASGARVSVYAPASLCGEARAVGRTRGWKVDGLTVRLVCLPPPERNGRADLAVAGANARRATEDSTSVAFLEEPTPAAGFSRSIVEAADIAWIEAPSGAAAMRQVIEALEERGSSTPRRAVLDQIG
ncbi:MAG TPA: hypothetical protein VFL77_02940 [Solirubrobacterales bacterium]|nr:hypothetical protein [Solirubrobacterales bacterium]